MGGVVFGQLECEYSGLGETQAPWPMVPVTSTLPRGSRPIIPKSKALAQTGSECCDTGSPLPVFNEFVSILPFSRPHKPRGWTRLRLLHFPLPHHTLHRHPVRTEIPSISPCPQQPTTSCRVSSKALSWVLSKFQLVPVLFFKGAEMCEHAYPGLEVVDTLL